MKFNLLNDVNLETIEFSLDGRNVMLNFIDMYKGNPLAKITCVTISSFTYRNAQTDDGLPCYIGEVYCEEISVDPKSKSHLFLVSGEVMLDVVCAQFIFEHTS